MFDAHCHLTDMHDFNIDDYAKLEGVINCAYDMATSDKAIRMSGSSSKIYTAVGISPQKCMTKDDIKAVAQFKNLIEKNHAIIHAIGEVGLDYHWASDAVSRHNQIQCFKQMINLAKQYEKPLVIHSRSSVAECIRLLNNFPNNVMFHFFSGNEVDARMIADRGWYISIPPLSGKLRKKVIKEVDIEYLLAETDAPYVGKTPLDTEKSIEIISSVKAIEHTEVEKCTAKNCLTFMKII